MVGHIQVGLDADRGSSISKERARLLLSPMSLLATQLGSTWGERALQKLRLQTSIALDCIRVASD